MIMIIIITTITIRITIITIIIIIIIIICYMGTYIYMDRRMIVYVCINLYDLLLQLKTYIHIYKFVL